MLRKSQQFECGYSNPVMAAPAVCPVFPEGSTNRPARTYGPACASVSHRACALKRARAGCRARPQLRPW
jgi:hypothetical protein